MVLAALMWSSAGVVTRQLHSAQGFEVTFWRSFFTVLALLVILPLWQGAGVFRRFPWRRGAFWLAGLCWATMFTAFMVALTMTGVARVLVTMAVAPLLTALLSRTVTGHRLPTLKEKRDFCRQAADFIAEAGWGYECLRMMAEHLDASERPMMHLISDWLNDPTTSRRHIIMRQALWAPVRNPSVLLGLAVGWASGGPAPNDPEPSPPHKAPVAINSAVLSCLARTQLRQRPVYLARFLDMAEALFRAY